MLEALSGGKPISLQRMVISSRTIDAFAASVRPDMIAGELAGGVQDAHSAGQYSEGGKRKPDSGLQPPKEQAK
jgi:hypothetical protein